MGKTLFLKSTGQQVFAMSWDAQATRPWPNDYTRVLRPFKGQEGLKTGNMGEVMVMSNKNLKKEN